jgi:hypothetical protein
MLQHLRHDPREWHERHEPSPRLPICEGADPATFGRRRLRTFHLLCQLDDSQHGGVQHDGVQGEGDGGVAVLHELEGERDPREQDGDARECLQRLVRFALSPLHLIGVLTSFLAVTTFVAVSSPLNSTCSDLPLHIQLNVNSIHNATFAAEMNAIDNGTLAHARDLAKFVLFPFSPLSSTDLLLLLQLPRVSAVHRLDPRRTRQR